MKQTWKWIAVILLGLAVSGCAAVQPIDASKPVDIGNGVTVTPQVAWGRINLGAGMFWTVDGAGLNELHFYTGIKSGQPIINIPGVHKDALGLYSSTMLPNDVQDLMVATLEKESFQNVRSDHLRPCPFGGATGFCFDLNFTDADGLAIRGSVIADKRADHLDVIFFMAPAEYYYDALSPTIQQLFSSIKVHGPD